MRNSSELSLKERQLRELAYENQLKSQLSQHNVRNKRPEDILLALSRTKKDDSKQKLEIFAEIPDVKQYLATQKLTNMEQLELLALSVEYVRLTKRDLDASDIHIIGAIRFFMPSALRPMATWKPNTRNPEKLKQGLLKHLFGKYAVPFCIEQSAVEGQKDALDAFVECSAGKSIFQYFQHEKYVFTRKMANALQDAPYFPKSWFKSIRYAQALGLNATEAQAMAFAEAVPTLREPQAPNPYAPENTLPEQFLIHILQFFVANPSLGTQNYGPLIDYLFHKKYQQLNGHTFSLSGRTPNALIRDMNEWHRETWQRRVDNRYPTQWKKVKVSDFDHIVGVGDRATLYTITQLNRQTQLFAESGKMQHCVASYISKCASGQCSIWTMEADGYQHRGKLLTIEMNDRRVIVQVRGKHNRLPDSHEKSILNLWMSREKIGCTQW